MKIPLALYLLGEWVEVPDRSAQAGFHISRAAGEAGRQRSVQKPMQVQPCTLCGHWRIPFLLSL